MQSFGISKPVVGGQPIWLTRASPFLAWGPAHEAARYPTKEAAWGIIGRLPYQDGSGALVRVLDEASAGAD